MKVLATKNTISLTIIKVSGKFSQLLSQSHQLIHRLPVSGSCIKFKLALEKIVVQLRLTVTIRAK
jgi:hypothetical protein